MNYKKQNIMLAMLLLALIIALWSQWLAGDVQESIGTLCYYAGRYDAALWWYHQAFEKDSGDPNLGDKITKAEGRTTR